jgi:DNA repair exonuclease SbcCD ATPase subunit
VVAVDHKPRIAELEQKIANFVRAIGEGLRDPELNAALKTARAELEQLKAVPPMRARAERKSESIERRVERMRERYRKAATRAGRAARAVPERDLARARSVRRSLPVGNGDDGLAG